MSLQRGAGKGGAKKRVRKATNSMASSRGEGMPERDVDAGQDGRIRVINRIDDVAWFRHAF